MKTEKIPNEDCDKQYLEQIFRRRYLIVGNELIAFYRDKVKRSWKIAFLSVVIIGLLVHLYKFTNYLPNRDSLVNVYHDQNIVYLGRWFLSIACGISSYFDLPMLIGVLSVLYIALSMVLITDLFHMENPLLIILSAGILVTFPGVTETFFYEYTADGYFLAMLLAAFAVWLTRLEKKRSFRNFAIGSVCICLTCGIYQSFVSFALVLVLFHFMYELLENSCDVKEMLRWALWQAAMFLVAMVAYYVIWKICLSVQNAGVREYQGIADIGSDLLHTFLRGFGRAAEEIVLYFVQWDFFSKGFSVFSVLNIVFLVFCFSMVMIAVVQSGLQNRKLRFLLYVLCAFLFAPFCCIWIFVTSGLYYRPMMLFTIALLYIFTLRLFERWAVPRWANIMAALIVVIVFNFSVMANIGYHYLFQCYEQTYAIGVHMMLELDDLRKDQNFDRIAVVGYDYLSDRVGSYDDTTKNQMESAGIGVFSQYLYNDLMYEHVRITTVLTRFFPVDLEPVPKQELKQYMEMEEVLDMPYWPEEGSMQVIGDTAVIKLSDVEPDESYFTFNN